MNIELRPWEYGDEASLINLYDHFDRSEIEYHFPEPGKYSEEEAKREIENYIDVCREGKEFVRAVCVDGKIVGHIQYTKREDMLDVNCDLFIILLPEYCGKGVGGEAVRQVMNHAFYEDKYDTVYASISKTNISARRMVEKVGMIYYGADKSYNWVFRSQARDKVLYVAKRPRKVVYNKGVEIRPWEERDHRALLRLFYTVDDRYIEIPFNPKDIHISFDYDSENAKKQEYEELMYCRDSIKYWNMGERGAGDIYRAILSDGEVVGLIKIEKNVGKRAIDGQLGYIMMPNYCGRGIATKAVGAMVSEAFGELGLHRLSAWVYKPNKASIRVLEKNGFTLEGCLREAVMCEGKATEYLCYGIVKEDKSFCIMVKM